MQKEININWKKMQINQHQNANFPENADTSQLLHRANTHVCGYGTVLVVGILQTSS